MDQYDRDKKKGQATYSYVPAQQKNIYAGCSKRPFSKAAASEDRRRTLWGTLRI